MTQPCMYCVVMMPIPLENSSDHKTPFKNHCRWNGDNPKIKEISRRRHDGKSDQPSRVDVSALGSQGAYLKRTDSGACDHKERDLKHNRDDQRLHQEKMQIIVLYWFSENRNFAFETLASV